MGPVGTAGYVLVATLAVEAVILGALAGAILWAVGVRLLWAAPVAAGAFLVVTVLLGSYRLEPAAVYGIPLVMLTFLTAWLIARYVERRAKWPRIWAMLAALGGAILVGFLWLLQSRLGLWTPVATALVADVCLIALLFIHRSRKAIAQ
jgi:hypothetical protein